MIIKLLANKKPGACAGGGGFSCHTINQLGCARWLVPMMCVCVWRRRGGWWGGAREGSLALRPSRGVCAEGRAGVAVGRLGLLGGGRVFIHRAGGLPVPTLGCECFEHCARPRSKVHALRALSSLPTKLGLDWHRQVLALRRRPTAAVLFIAEPRVYYADPCGGVCWVAMRCGAGPAPLICS